MIAFFYTKEAKGQAGVLVLGVHWKSNGWTLKCTTPTLTVAKAIS